ncbi:MAG TPA: hypothetical protein VJU87_03890 [Gemmatimonadaceae bacterium]|nr:hypothetical protein [Gemmatimonadaceae bacterium]
MRPAKRLGVRWTIGDVSGAGWEALRYSVWGAQRLFGDDADYVVCVNSVPLRAAREHVAPLPPAVALYDVTGELAPEVAAHLDESKAEGVGWKFAPMRLFPHRYELALDNDCILWDLPAAMVEWLRSAARCLFAEDVRAGYGQFAVPCGSAPRNSGIRGLPPEFDFGAVIQEVLREHPVTLRSELDEQGLQYLAVSRRTPPLVVSAAEVTICSPFHPHRAWLGTCGAHFVGLNARELPWEYYGRPATVCRREHWQEQRQYIDTLVPIPDA